MTSDVQERAVTREDPLAPLPRRVEVAIIGSGFGGLCMAIRLRHTGIEDFVLLEKEHEVGGCWRDNTYPGAACDVPSHLYSFSFERKTDWSRHFASQVEILDYLRHCAGKYGLRRHLHVDTEVTGAEFDEAAGLWRIHIADGRTLEARVLVSACGQLNRPALPRLPGLERFEGKQFHSARWDHGYPLEGRTVAVIGTGASAIQFVPQIAPRVKQLFLYQRSAPYVLPKPDRAYGWLERALFSRLPASQLGSRWWTYWQYESRVLVFEGPAWVSGILERRFHRHLERSVPDPRLRQTLTPTDPIGCKRVLLSNDYYPALTRPNVEVVTEGIREVTRHGLITVDGKEREVDALIHGTGFQATDFLAPMRITGRGGRELNAAWREGAEAYLGLTVSGFPNLFLLYGPNTNLGHNSIVFMLESQVRYVLACLRVLRERNLRFLDVRPDAQRDFNARLQRSLERSVWAADCSSWYKTADGRNTNNWPGFTFHYRRQTRGPRLAHYEAVHVPSP
ncbi:NAD(P)/FAD-dependent oxidoreductase [Archangium gephyra]|nr:NAD(P)/FAD-dependent oxidoreductase [Archangium gephyra]